VPPSGVVIDVRGSVYVTVAEAARIPVFTDVDKLMAMPAAPLASFGGAPNG